MPEPSPELEAEMENLRDMAAQLEVALASLKKQIDAADAAKAARKETGHLDSSEGEQQA